MKKKIIKVKKQLKKSKSLPKKRKVNKKRVLIESSNEPTKRPFINIKVVGIGGGGGNAISRMSRDFNVKGVQFIAINTDIQDLDHCDAHKKIHIGKFVTKGMGAGMNPDLGEQAAEENRAEIAEALKGADMVFFAAGFGGGTGTGATPIIAEIAREGGALTAAIITKPFTFEGNARRQIAEEGFVRLKDKVDTLLIIPNDRIFNIIDNDTPIIKAFEKIDEILKSAVQGVAEIITVAGVVNVDFADVKTVMSRAGMAVIGVGVASGPERAMKAVTQATNSPLLENSIDNARGVLFGVSGGKDLKMVEINEAAKLITEHVDPSAKIIFGAYHDKKLKEGQLKIILVATGFSGSGLRTEIDSLGLFNSKKGFVGLSGSLKEPLDVTPEESKRELLPGKIESSLKDPTEKAKKIFTKDSEQAKKDDDFWDVPTFLRRKKK